MLAEFDYPKNWTKDLKKQKKTPEKLLILLLQIYDQREKEGIL